MRRRWTVQAHDEARHERWLIVDVPEGAGEVHVFIGGTHLVYEPCQMARLREIYLEALAVAVFDRDGW